MQLCISNSNAFRCTNGDFYVALGSSMGLELLVWVGGGLLKRVLYFFGDEPSLGQKSLILHLVQQAATTIQHECILYVSGT